MVGWVCGFKGSWRSDFSACRMNGWVCIGQNNNMGVCATCVLGPERAVGATAAVVYCVCVNTVCVASCVLMR